LIAGALGNSTLISTHVPLVFVSDSDAPDVRQIQHELGLMQPFISSGGCALAVMLASGSLSTRAISSAAQRPDQLACQ